MKWVLFTLLTVVLVATSQPFSFKPAAAHTSPGADPPIVAPEQVGLDSNRLLSIRTAMNKHVAEKRIPGASALNARRGKIAYQESFGMADVEAGKPMKLDTIHRIYSMMKPITTGLEYGSEFRVLTYQSIMD